MQRLNDELLLATQRLKQIMDRFDSLMDEGRYDIADNEVGPEVAKLAGPDSPLTSSVIIGGRTAAVHARHQSGLAGQG